MQILDLADQTDTSSIYFFDHRGCQQGETCLQNFPVRQLSADVGFKYLWGVDRHQHSGMNQSIILLKKVFASSLL